MATLWLDDEGIYYYEKSATELISQNGKYLFRITITPPADSYLLQEDGASYILQEDGVSKFIQE